MKEKLNYLNIGCGKRFHKAWINLDVLPADTNVIHCDVTKGLPFKDDSMDMVYHSHVLEHLSQEKGKQLINECYRVLKKGGILRVVVPDLEQIVRNYLLFLEKNLTNPTKESKANYHWTMMELYDQVIRNQSGGQMTNYLTNNPSNKEFILSRLGEEVRPIIEGEKRKLSLKEKMNKFFKMSGSAQLFLLKSIFSTLFHRFLPGWKYYKVGRFRMGGEVHQWMYDRYSLNILLEEAGFNDVKVNTANSSAIAGWSEYGLDSDGEHVFKPDSLFMEGVK